jgi:hypothetical protein
MLELCKTLLLLFYVLLLFPLKFLCSMLPPILLFTSTAQDFDPSYYKFSRIRHIDINTAAPPIKSLLCLNLKTVNICIKVVKKDPWPLHISTELPKTLPLNTPTHQRGNGTFKENWPRYILMEEGESFRRTSLHFQMPQLHPMNGLSQAKKTRIQSHDCMQQNR